MADGDSGCVGPYQRDNGAEFTTGEVRGWPGNVGVKALYIGPGSPWENAYVGSYNGKLHYEPLNGKISYTRKQAKALIETGREHYKTIRLLNSLG